MGLLEMAFLGGIGWIIVWLVWVFLKTLLYAVLSATTGFSGLYIGNLPIEQSLARPFIWIGDIGFNSVDAVVVLLLVATGMFLWQFLGAFSNATSRVSSAMGL